jgi:hypothetical protein
MALAVWNADRHSASPPTRNACIHHHHTRNHGLTAYYSLPPSKTTTILKNKRKRSIHLSKMISLPTTAKTTISFFTKASCDANTRTAGDSFETDKLAAQSGICYKPPVGTVALDVLEVDEGCSSMLPTYAILPRASHSLDAVTIGKPFS